MKKHSQPRQTTRIEPSAAKAPQFRSNISVFRHALAIMGAVTMIAPGNASAQEVVLDCLDNSSGPTVGSASPFSLGMCQPDITGTSGSEALGISGNGQVAVGYTVNDAVTAAVTWSALEGTTILDPITMSSATLLWRGRAASFDGSVVVGNARNEVNAARPTRWVNGTLEDLGSLLGFASNRQGNAFGVNSDGTVVVGWASGSTSQRPFRWVQGSTSGPIANPQMHDLGTLRSTGTGTGIAYSVNEDGTVVVGDAQNATATRAFRWVEGGTGGVTGNLQMQDLGTLRTDATGTSGGRDVNTDGTVVVGEAHNDAGALRAFRWVEGATSGAATNPQMHDLGTLKLDGSGASSARGVNTDGTVIVGSAENDSAERRAFRWVSGATDGFSANLQMQDLGTLRADGSGQSWANSVSDDGKVVVGRADADDGQLRAFIWRIGTVPPEEPIDPVDPTDPVDPIAPVEPVDPTVPTEPVDPTAPPTSETPESGSGPVQPGIMQDLENLLASFPMIANDTQIAGARQQWVMGRLLDDTCFAGAAGRNCFAISATLSNIGADPAAQIGSQTGTVGRLTFGRGLSDQVTIGATLSFATDTLRQNGVNTAAGWGASGWAEYSEGSLARTGWQAAISVGYMAQDINIARGFGLANVQAATGAADLSSTGIRASLGYGFTHESGWLITPGATLTHIRTSRGAYAEDPNATAFSASFDALTMTRTTAAFGVTGKLAINDRSRFTLGLGVETDLKAKPARLKGTTNIPGLASFGIESALERNDLRPWVSAEYGVDLSNGGTITASARIGTPDYGNKPQVDIGIRYEIKF
jgi:probable HAF family extracellular repeat protein